MESLIGKKFHNLLVINIGPTHNSKRSWICICDCGNEFIAVGSRIKSGQVKSCGCLFLEKVTKHGETIGKRSPEYISWMSMRARCLNTKSQHYAIYRGRGIKICDRWKDSVGNFISDMGRRPSKKHSIERKNRDGNYEPSNCIWATSEIQQNNRSNNRVLSFNGKLLTAAQWEKEMGLPESCISSRLNKGWSIEKSITSPIDIRKQRFRLANNLV